MTSVTTSAFDLPAHLAAKADAALIGADEQHFVAISVGLRQSIADLTDRLAAERKAPGGIGRPRWTATCRSTGRALGWAP